MQRDSDGRLLSSSDAPVDATAVAPAAPDDLSLRERVQARHRELEREPDHAILLPVPGYEQDLLVEYRALTYREQFAIETKLEGHKDEAERVLFIAVDKLIAACVRIVEPTGTTDEYKDTGFRWNANAARDLFGCNLPDDARARQGLLAIFSGDDGEERLILHAAEYEVQRVAARRQIERRAEGE